MRGVLAVALLLAATFSASLHTGFPCDEPWTCKGFLGLAAFCVGGAFLLLRRAPTRSREDAPPVATPWRIRRALLATAIGFVTAFGFQRLPEDSWLSMPHVAFAVAGIAMMGILPVSPRIAFPWRMRGGDLSVALACGMFGFGAFVFDHGAWPMPSLAFVGEPSMWIPGLVLAPLVEEAFFRGVLWRACRVYAPPWVTVVVVATAFVGAHHWLTWHGQASTTVYVIAIVGLLFGWLRHRTGSIAPGVLAHFIVNASTLAWMWPR